MQDKREKVDELYKRNTEMTHYGTRHDVKNKQQKRNK